MATMTFKAARAMLLRGLADKGWVCSSGLKVDHARSPEGDVAVYFKSQSVHFAPLRGTESASAAFRNAHSLFVDPRSISVGELIETAKRCAARAGDGVG